MQYFKTNKLEKKITVVLLKIPGLFLDYDPRLFSKNLLVGIFSWDEISNEKVLCLKLIQLSWIWIIIGTLYNPWNFFLALRGKLPAGEGLLSGLMLGFMSVSMPRSSARPELRSGSASPLLFCSIWLINWSSSKFSCFGLVKPIIIQK